MKTFFQAGTLVGFLQGIYDGDFSFERLAKKGNFGLGTLNAVDGEMVGVDGVFYRIDSKGLASPIPPSACTPFSVVTQFKSSDSFIIENIHCLNQLNSVLDSHLSTPNIFYMIRIDGEMESIKLRSESCQIREYLPLAQALPSKQTEFELTNSTGTLVVSHCPKYSASFTIPGYHYHYINDQRTTGGHVFDVKFKSARVMINAIRRFNMAICNTEDFDQADLNINIFDALEKVEHAQTKHTLDCKEHPTNKC